MAESGQDENPDVVTQTISVDSVISSEELAQLRKTNIALEGRNYELRETIRQLRLQSAAIESERDQYKRETKKIKGELEQYRTPPLVIGTIESVASDGRVIVRSTTGPQFLSKVSENVSKTDLVPGSQCALHPQSFVIVEVLPNKYDALVTGMEVETAPEVSYADVGGLDKQMTLLKEAVELPLLKPELFEKVGIEPPKGVLLCGPPGTGKTLLAKAVAHETNATFIRVVGSELVQKYIGEGARLVRELFSLAREKAPAIIFIDEIDAIGSSRSTDAYSAGDHEVNRTLMQLLSELDGFNTRGNVKIIAATNRIDILDQALLRPGRFDRIIEFPLPDEEGRKTILSIHTRKMHLEKSVSLETIARETPDTNGSELMAICVEAGMNA
ncbi:MAG: proteasome-activating nucleotidase, partial [Methanocorpusculum sp.]|nr:proteasome-activating nucleotidase [Methanocorpusculum sp.]MDD3257622.1 proteasome-activating nucleotidase [Methanocorpusculum sp.]MDD4133342.1 proteasome-activating nucleotidase [Methanocorpusculum sp.]